MFGFFKLVELFLHCVLSMESRGSTILESPPSEVPLYWRVHQVRFHITVIVLPAVLKTLSLEISAQRSSASRQRGFALIQSEELLGTMECSVYVQTPWLLPFMRF